MGIHAWQFSRDRQIEQRQTEGFRVIKRTVQNGVDNCACIFDGDTFAGAIPAGVNQISLRACCLHTFHQHLSILRRVQRQECGAEAGGEGGGRFGDAAFGAGQFSGETRQEVVLRLVSG
ncbi:Uncharacterised protein [Salmonella enterica subsp. enterica serovar Bovismorbificans]|nr:Uncharacterised protein [Salmonella enterica subsp. enterica serovar Bovismorbificans]